MNYFLVLFLLIFNNRPLPLASAELTVHVSNVQSATAPLKIAVYNDASKFPDEEGYFYAKTIVPGRSGAFDIVISGLGEGEYALALYQDIDNNGKLSTNFFGYPKEPFCFSNNVKPVFSAPSFSKCKVKITAPRSTVSVKLID